MIIDIPIEIAEVLDEILGNWCQTRTNEECCSCHLLDNYLCCFLVDFHNQLMCSKSEVK